MEFDKLLEKRVSTRQFLKEKLSDTEIEKLLDAAKKSPMGCGFYDMAHLTVITDKNLIEQMAEEYKEITGKNADPFFDANTFIMFSSKKDDTCAYEDAGCVIEHICLMATQMGLGSCYIRGPINAMGDKAKYIKKLELPLGFRPISGVVIGKIDKELVGKVHEINVNYIK